MVNLLRRLITILTTNTWLGISTTHFQVDMRPDTFNAQRPNNGGSSRSGGTTRTTPTVERGETHTGNVPQNDRKKN